MKSKISKKSKGVETRDQYTVVLEDIRSQVKGVAEGVSALDEKMDRRFKTVDERLGKVDENLRLMRAEISLIRHNQITRDEFKALEDRVFTIERKIAK